MTEQHRSLGSVTEAFQIGGRSTRLGMQDLDDDAAALRPLLGQEALAV